jgi:tellurite resistance protein TerC
VDLWIWGVFVGFVLAMLSVDLFVVNRDAHEISVAEATRWGAVWIGLGLAFGAILWVWRGSEAAGQYLAGFVIEQSLSVDNIFVFALIFAAFAMPAELQHRVLFWGILGALAFRALFIAAGIGALETVHWSAYIFGGFLVFTGIKMARRGDVTADPRRNPIVRGIRRLIPSTETFDGQRFWTRIDGRRLATPMLTTLVMIEVTDVMFAADSIPAILAVTRDPFLVFTSNAFAIMGLRNLYFLLSGTMKRFAYVKTGLAVVLAFVGVKMLLSDLYTMPIWLSLVVIGLVIGASILASLRLAPDAHPDEPPAAPSSTPATSHDDAHGPLETGPEDMADLRDIPRTGHWS